MQVRLLDDRLVPYLAVLPRLWVTQAQTSQTAATRTLWGVEGLLGLQVNVLAGGPFAEVGYRYATALQLTGGGEVSLSALTASVGWRLHW